MQLRQRERGPVTRWGGLVVLLVFAAGFFTMHGFLALSASAETHPPQHAVGTDFGTHAQATAGGTGTSGTGAPQAAHAGAAPGPAPDRPEPAQHHDLLAGCVVALVGIGLAGLTLLSMRRSWTAADRRGFVSRVVRAIGPSAARWSPPRVALCVIRV